jgi:hypothetical protein
VNAISDSCNVVLGAAGVCAAAMLQRAAPVPLDRPQGVLVATEHLLPIILRSHVHKPAKCDTHAHALVYISVYMSVCSSMCDSEPLRPCLSSHVHCPAAVVISTPVCRDPRSRCHEFRACAACASPRESCKGRSWTRSRPSHEASTTSSMRRKFCPCHRLAAWHCGSLRVQPECSAYAVLAACSKLQACELKAYCYSRVATSSESRGSQYRDRELHWQAKSRHAAGAHVCALCSTMGQHAIRAVDALGPSAQLMHCALVQAVATCSRLTMLQLSDHGDLVSARNVECLWCSASTQAQQHSFDVWAGASHLYGRHTDLQACSTRALAPQP